MPIPQIGGAVKAIGLAIFNFYANKMKPILNQKDPNSLLGDKVLLGATLIGAAAALFLSIQSVNAEYATFVVAILCIGALGGFLLLKGRAVCRYLLTFTLVSIIALQIQLTEGQLEWHFGVFVTLAFLLVYLDWKVIIYGAALFAVHHILFDRLQAAGYGTYCTAKPDFLIVLLHASYVIVQSGVEILLAITMGRAAKEGRQLSNLVAAVSKSNRISLNIASVEASTPGSIDLKNTLLRMETAVDAVRSGSETIDISCEEIAKGNLDLSIRTEQTAGNLENAAASMAELSLTTQKSAQNSKEAKLMAEQASNIASKGRDVVDHVITTMRDIQESSRKISDIISVIDGIAFQTNILALNAAVEAARAGEKGRGFAVVASEVRSLAGRSAAAANEIKSLINMSEVRVKTGTTLVGQAGETMSEVVLSIQKVDQIVTAINTASIQQASFAAQVGEATSEIDSATQQNAALVEEMAVAASSLRNQSKDLVEATAIFQTANSKR